MESPVLPLCVEYRCTPEANLAHYELLAGGCIDRRWWKCISWQQPATLLCLELLAIVWSLVTGSVLLACILAVGAWWHVMVVVGGYQRAMVQFDQSMMKACDKEIRLEVSERGFLEHDCGVESFCPWSAMKSYRLVDQVLFVEMANTLWAIIPAATLKPDTVTLGHIEAVLVRHGVLNRP